MSHKNASTLRDQSIERILIVKPSSLGDIVHAFPVLHALRRRYPHARIDWLIASGLASLLEGHSDLNDVIRFDRSRYGQMWRSPVAGIEFVQFIKVLRSRRYDLVIDLQGLFRTGFIARATGARTRIGFRSSREGASFFYTHIVDDTKDEMHAVDRYMLVGALLGFDSTPVHFDVQLGDQEISALRQLLEKNGIQPDKRWIAIVPAARWETKLWPSARFANVIDELQSKENWPCVLLGAKDESAICQAIVDACQIKPINLAGQTSIRGFAALLGLASSVLCLDSAAAHLAVARNRPLVCITGPTNPRRTGPYGRLHDVVRLDLPCSPCYLRRLQQCPHDHRCMEELPAENVLAALRQSLNR